MNKKDKDSEFARKIDGLIEEFEKSPNVGQKQMAAYAKQVRKTRKEIEKSIAGMQESLDYLRVCIKYMVFDLEATRRENDYLRQLLAEDQNE